MKLYYSKGACSLAVHIILNEIGVDYELEAVNLKTKQTDKGTNFYTINPKGSVPVLMIDNKQVLTENAVILQYLADTYKAYTLLPQVNHFEHYQVLEWLNFISTDLHKSFGPLFNANVPQEIKDSIFIPLLKSKIEYLNNHLKNHVYLMGDQFTLPDGYLFVILTWLKIFKIDIKQWASLAAYYEKLKTRPSIQKSLENEANQPDNAN